MKAPPGAAAMFHAVVAAAAVALPVGPAPTPETVRAAIDRALPLLAKGAAGHAEQKTCFACHNQGVPMVAFAAADARGFALPDALIREQAEHVHDFLTRNADLYRTGKGTGGQADTAGWALYTLYHAGWPVDDTTAAVAEYLLKKDADRGFWRCSSTRPPTEASAFATTYLAVRGLKAFATEEQQERAKTRTAAARDWLVKTPAKDTEDRVFRLRGLSAAGATADQVKQATAELAKGQRADGGWGQLDSMPSDPYATGSALAALREVGGMPASDASFGRGLAFLLRTQRADGSWYVKSRSKPFQPYYESGFPHEKDQFISAAATGWAIAALAGAVPVESKQK